MRYSGACIFAGSLIFFSETVKAPHKLKQFSGASVIFQQSKGNHM